MNHCVVFAGDDAYEIYYNHRDITQILMYRDGRDVKAETIELESMPFHIQRELLVKFNRHLIRHNGHSPKPTT